MNIIGTIGAMAGPGCIQYTCDLVDSAGVTTSGQVDKQFNLPFHHHHTMTQGQAVPESIQWIIIRLSATMPAHEISGYTDISDRKVRDILAHFKNTGSIIVSKCEKATLHKSLQDEDIQVFFISVLLLYTHLYYIASFYS